MQDLEIFDFIQLLGQPNSIEFLPGSESQEWLPGTPVGINCIENTIMIQTSIGSHWQRLYFQLNSNFERHYKVRRREIPFLELNQTRLNSILEERGYGIQYTMSQLNDEFGSWGNKEFRAVDTCELTQDELNGIAIAILS